MTPSCLPGGGASTKARGNHVHAGVLNGVGDAAAHVDLRGQVVDHLGPHCGDSLGQVWPSHVDLVVAHPAGGERACEVVEATAGQIVDHGDLVPVAGQSVDKVGADEPGTAGHRDGACHHLLL
jgi:GMP synthase-like glutamine amidotransferase